jgi:hypothetical protein
MVIKDGNIGGKEEGVYQTGEDKREISYGVNEE